MGPIIGFSKNPFCPEKPGHLHLRAVGHGYWPTWTHEDIRKFQVTQILEFRDQRGDSYMIGYVGDEPMFGERTKTRPFRPFVLPHDKIVSVI